MQQAGSAMNRWRQKIPSGAGVLFFIQIFSTLSYAVLYSTLVLYTTQGLRLSDQHSTSITATFVVFNYALHLVGGYIGGRFYSYRLLFIIGLLMQVTGCLMLAYPSVRFLYWGLAIYVTASGMNVTCINCMLTQLFDPHDKRRESAFLWNYSGMNIGFFVGFMVAGYFQLQQAFSTLFILSSLGGVIAILITVTNYAYLKDVKTYFSESDNRANRRFLGMAFIVCLVLAIYQLIQHAHLSSDIVMGLGGVMTVLIAYLAVTQSESEARKKLWAYLILGVASLIFWAIYQMIPLGITLFIQRNVDRTIGSIVIAPQWFANINTIIIILGGPVMAFLLHRLREKGLQISVPKLFSISLILIGCSMLALVVGIRAAGPLGYTNVWWVVLCYTLLAIAELCLSPIGYALVGQLAPIKLRGVLMGTWMMIVGVGAAFSNIFSRQALTAGAVHNPLLTNPGFERVFLGLAGGALVVGVILFFMIPFVRRLMGSAQVQYTS